MKKYVVYAMGENPAGFWRNVTKWRTLEEAKAQAEKEKIDEKIYCIYIRCPGGKIEYILGNNRFLT